MFPSYSIKSRTDNQVTKVAEPSNYGVVVTKPNSTVIDRFVEKPVEFVGNRINAGIYLFNPSVLDRIEVSFPALFVV
jgi:mannose-1-phosphate guanylyltransferase